MLDTVKKVLATEIDEIIERHNTEAYAEDFPKLLELRNKLFAVLGESERTLETALDERESNRWIYLGGRKLLKENVCSCMGGTGDCISGCGY